MKGFNLNESEILSSESLKFITGGYHFDSGSGDCNYDASCTSGCSTETYTLSGKKKKRCNYCCVAEPH